MSKVEEFMKKVILILFIFIVSISSIYSKSTDVSLLATIDETDITYNLFYENDLIADKTKDYEVSVTPLTQDGQTGYFSIKASSNLNKDKSVHVVINPQKFKRTKESESPLNNTHILPSVEYTTNNNVLHAGINANTIVTEFYLYWQGDESLPSGIYESNVIIEYNII